MQKSVVDLESCLAQVEASKAWFARRVLPLSLSQLRWRPHSGHWSIAQCLEHLNLMLGLSLPRLAAAVAEGWERGVVCTGACQFDAPEIEALHMIDPPVDVPITSPREATPAAAIDIDLLVDNFHLLRDQYAAVVRRASGLDLSRLRIVDPVVPEFRTVGATLAYLAAHDRRHMWQVERICNSPRFPVAVR